MMQRHRATATVNGGGGNGGATSKGGKKGVTADPKYALAAFNSMSRAQQLAAQEKLTAAIRATRPATHRSFRPKAKAKPKGG